MSLSLTGVVADVEKAFTTVVDDAPAAVTALEALLKIVEDAKPLLPAEDQAYVADGEAIVNGLISVLSKV